ncbi:MAG: hypothetical protein CVV44_18920 [Spirochaetae bacterium HGW-Spirochaetae-1]|jgi:hypothetical protein|nr:MAG: hypothetical protein CVV44_18920 [Spirochaetae bacterium HGW-Spirochaetae-1]
MIKFSIFSIFILLNLYALTRIRTLLKKPSTKTLVSCVYGIVVAAFPITELLSHSSYGDALKYLLLPGYYSLPFLLYVVLLVILQDILLLANRVLNVISRETLEGPRYRAAMLGIITVIPLLFIIIGTINYNTIRVSEYSINIPAKSSKIRSIKVSLAADLHLRDITGRQFVVNFVKTINSLNPDILLIPGDILEGDNNNMDTSDFETLFKDIRTRYGVYASPGNHESHGPMRSFDFLKKANITLLRDEYRTIADSFYLVGRNDRNSDKRKKIKDILKDAPAILPVLVLDHRPLNSEDADDMTIDVQLSGHTHNGQLFPLNFIVRYLNTLSWGYKKTGNTHLFVTSGIQGWGPPVRTAGISEIMVININFVKQ